jgi:signal transduction histidine kinase
VKPFRSGYNWIVCLTGLALVLITLGIEYFQYNRNRELILIDLKNRLHEHTLNVNLRARAIQGYVTGLKTAAENTLFYIKTFQTTSPLFSDLKNNAAGNAYALNIQDQKINQAMVGNLTGLGSLESLSQAIKTELNMALLLNTYFEIALKNNRGAVWVYYTSKNHFQNLFPTSPSLLNTYHPALENKFFFQGALPLNNPSRKNFWTPAYQDGIADGIHYQKGIVVTNSSPVYEGDTFLGIVSLDLSLSELNRVMQRFETPEGILLLINKEHQVLATNAINSAPLSEEKILKFEKVVDPSLVHVIDQEMKSPSGWFLSENKSLVYVMDTHEAPWFIVYIASTSKLFAHTFYETLEDIFAITSILIFVVGVGYLIVIRNFISPAQKLVDHISKENQDIKSTPQNLPTRWKPWFDIVSHIFAENRTLMTDLENRVKLRTKQLQQKNTQLEKTLSDLNKAQNQIIVQEKLASLGALTAGIAHEIKNPLNFIINFSELSLEYLEELKGKISNENELFALIEQNMLKTQEHAERADSIVKGMLAHARGSTGEIESFNLNKLLEDAIDLAYVGFQGKENYFTTKITKKFDAKIENIEGSKQDLARVFLNIVNNACFAMHEKKEKLGDAYQPELIIKTKNQKNSVLITFEDNGPGMSTGLMKKIFNPFFTTKDSGVGTGLGLSLSQDIIIHQHHGHLSVESKLGQYSKFIIEIPHHANQT